MAYCRFEVLIMLEQFMHEGTWKNILLSEMEEVYFQLLENELFKEIGIHKISPNLENIFQAFNLCPFEKVKVIIIGQDPYVNPSLANGLAFSVSDGCRIPPTLLNIYKCLNKDLGCYIPNHGNLEYWTQQGVLLLNSVLTTRSSASKSHRNIGWHQFTDNIIYELSERKNNLVFMLWGREAKKKELMIDHDKHLVLVGPHPSPIIASNQFIENKCFSKCNEFLYEVSPTIIDWQIPSK